MKEYFTPPIKKQQPDFFVYQPNIGTKFAYDYVVKKRKQIINLF